MWKEHKELFLEYTRWILKEKLSDRGVVMGSIEDFDEILLQIGKKYNDYYIAEKL